MTPCRFAASNPVHVCGHHDGAALKKGATCFVEALAQLREQAEAEATVTHTTDPTVYRMLAQGAVSAQRRKEGPDSSR